jgi:hypothetical protein
MKKVLVHRRHQQPEEAEVQPGLLHQAGRRTYRQRSPRPLYQGKRAKGLPVVPRCCQWYHNVTAKINDLVYFESEGDPCNPEWIGSASVKTSRCPSDITYTREVELNQRNTVFVICNVLIQIVVRNGGLVNTLNILRAGKNPDSNA